MDILDTVALFGAAALAAPVGLLGVEFLVGGRALDWLQSDGDDADPEGE